MARTSRFFTRPPHTNTARLNAQSRKTVQHVSSLSMWHTASPSLAVHKNVNDFSFFIALRIYTPLNTKLI